MMTVNAHDPKPRKDGKCAQCKDHRVPEIARACGDPFCSSACCRAYYGVELPPTESQVRQEKAKREREAREAVTA